MLSNLFFLRKIGIIPVKLVFFGKIGIFVVKLRIYADLRS